MGAPLLATDGYKFSMAEAGWPLRRETFYVSHRKGGLQVLPFDVETELRRILPEIGAGDWAWLAQHDYEMGSGFKASITRAGDVSVRALPKGAVFHDREPIASFTGPSGLVSWLEPLVLQWSYRVQVATEALLRPEGLRAAVGTVTCAAQRDVVLETLDAVGVKAPPITVDEAGYVARVRAKVRELAQIVGDPGRLFEVGLRAATCLPQHLLALEACKAEGLVRTSHVHGAQVVGMVPVGTMGHEHVQRYGSDDAAFRAMVERRWQRSSFLLDTYDTIGSGIPAAFELIRERPGQLDSIRYDSGDKEMQYRFAAARARELGIRPIQILEDGFDAPQTRRFEALRAEVGWRPEEQVYGYGGYLVAQPSGTTLTRDRVSAVYKLTQTGRVATMKFGNEAATTGARPPTSLTGKQSIPGRPVLFRRSAGRSGPFGVVGQEGESVPEGYALLTGAAQGPSLAEARSVRAEDLRLAFSPATQALVDALTAKSFGGRA